MVAGAVLVALEFIGLAVPKDGNEGGRQTTRARLEPRHPFALAMARPPPEARKGEFKRPRPPVSLPPQLFCSFTGTAFLIRALAAVVQISEAKD